MHCKLDSEEGFCGRIENAALAYARAGGGLILCLLGAGCGPEEPEPDTRPNFLFLLADDQRADTISAHGNQYIETPHLDRLAFQGFSFRSNYCLGSNSAAVCVPSRAMIHSGLAYHRIRNDLEGVRTLPEILREQGYVTFGTGTCQQL